MSDLADDLNAAFDEAVSDPIENPETPEAVEPGTPEPVEPAAEPVEPEAPTIDFPAAWKKDYSEHWGTLPRDVQQYIVEREKQAQQGINEKGQALSELEKQYQPLQEVIQPYAQTFAMQGMTPVQGISQLLAYQQALTENPQETLMQLAQAYGVDLQQAFENQPYVDPQVQTLQQKLESLEQQQAQAAQSQQQRQHEAIVEQIAQFASAADESGNPKHPHFESVYDDIVTLMQMGRASSLEDAYAKAVQYNPEVQAQLREQQEQVVAEQKAAEAQKAREAARTVTSKRAADPAPSDKSLRDDLMDQLEAAGME